MPHPASRCSNSGASGRARDSGGFSWRNAVVAEIGGEIAACLVGYRLDDPYELGGLADTPEIVRPLVKLEAKAPGSWYVNVLATFPEFRRARHRGEAPRHRREQGRAHLPRRR